MRVLVITPWFPSGAAPGSGIFNLRDVELLALDHEVRVLHLCAPALLDADREREAAPDVRVRQVPYSMSRPATLLPAIRQIRRAAAHADLVHTMAFPALFPVARSRVRAPWVHTEHWSGLVSVPHSLRARLGSAVLRPDLRRPDAVVAVGAPLARVIDGYRRDATAVIGNRVRLAAPGSLPQPPEDRGSEPLRLIGVGNVIGAKGALEAVRAVELLARRGIDARLEWVGEGPLSAEMRGLAQQLGIAERVSLLGHRPPEEVSAALTGAHLFVLPTAGETFGVAVAEALGHGLPVVTSGTGGHLEFLPPEASRVTAERSGAAVASAIEELVADPLRWSGARIAEYARARFSEEARRRAYSEVYRSARNGASVRA